MVLASVAHWILHGLFPSLLQVGDTPCSINQRNQMQENLQEFILNREFLYASFTRAGVFFLYVFSVTFFFESSLRSGRSCAPCRRWPSKGGLPRPGPISEISKSIHVIYYSIDGIRYIVDGIWHFQVSTVTASIPPTVPKLTLKPPLNSRKGKPWIGPRV